MPLAFVFGIFTVMLVRSREVAVWQAVVIALFGVYTAASPVGLVARDLVEWFLGRLLA